VYRISEEETQLLKSAPLENLEILKAVSAVITHGESQEFYMGFVSALKLAVEMAKSHEVKDDAFYPAISNSNH